MRGIIGLIVGLILLKVFFPQVGQVAEEALLALVTLIRDVITVAAQNAGTITLAS